MPQSAQEITGKQNPPETVTVNKQWFDALLNNLKISLSNRDVEIAALKANAEIVSEQQVDREKTIESLVKRISELESEDSDDDLAE